MLFATPDLTDSDRAVLTEIEQFRRMLRYHLAEPRRWTGSLRRNLKARAIRGSNSIEGYDVSLDDALALVEDEEPLDADERTKLEIIGYRNALTYIQQLAEDAEFCLDQSLLRSLHFIMLGHDLTKRPGRWRKGAIYVRDDETGEVVYEGPDIDLVPGLMKELVEEMSKPHEDPIFVRGAMAHLDLVMIHPFSDGNGRMARALQTLSLARGQILAPEFSSIEEWLGRNTNAYYNVLAQVGAGSWHPERAASSWIRFNLVAHHMQAQTVARRVRDSVRLWDELEKLVSQKRVPERSVTLLYDAAIGHRVRRSQYERDAEIETGTAGRDLRILTAAGLIEARGEARARHYIGTAELRAIWTNVIQGRMPIRNPYRDLELDNGDSRRPLSTAAPRDSF
jgi:Fic family protein